MSAIATAADIAAAIGAGQRSAGEVIEAALAGIERGNKRLNAFTAVTADRAHMRAAMIDAAIARGEPASRWRGCRSQSRT